MVPNNSGLLFIDCIKFYFKCAGAEGAHAPAIYNISNQEGKEKRTDCLIPLLKQILSMCAPHISKGHMSLC